MKRFASFLIIAAFLFSNTATVKADEGMWLPFLVQHMQMQKMQELGLQLTAEDIYSINQSSLKDAIIALDHGSCTGELISPDGLFLTNHHCGYGEIQAHSTVEHDYLTNGFWAMDRSEELPNPDKTVSFLISIEDVTEKINSKLNDAMSEEERSQMIQTIAGQLEREATRETHYEASVEHFFEGNQFFLFVYETFMDVRLVGAPPSSIGKFGGDTDNWMWPRHTGDFSLFRVYCGPDGKPAEYSEENVPYHPKHFLPVSTKGVEEGDFAMILGYPGSTQRYLTSWGVQQTMEQDNPIRVKIREAKQAIMKEAMNSSDAIRIQYASKYSRSSNYWKYSIGQNKGLDALNVVEKKQELERRFYEWVNQNNTRRNKYGNALKMIETAYEEGARYNKATQYWFEAIYLGPEIIRFALRNRGMANLLSETPDEKEAIAQEAATMREFAEDFYKDYHAPTDQKIMAALFAIYAKDIEKEFHPSFFEEAGDDFAKYAEKVYKKSILVNPDAYYAFLDDPDAKTLENDIGYQMAVSALNAYLGVMEKMQPVEAGLTEGRRLFVAGLMEMDEDKLFYPDANSTMRLTYGTVGGYQARDAVYYEHYTTLQGYMEKEDPNNDEFTVPQKLKELYENKDFGRWGEDGEMRVCFLTNNDITGGNSGSPVINGNGELIGCAFDGNWEAMSGDIAFEPELQRTICVDIRYVLFIIDKYAGASHLIDEMKLVE